MSCSLFINNIDSISGGTSSLFTQTNRSSSSEQKQPLEERNVNTIRQRPVQQEFSFSTVFGESHPFYSASKNYQMKDFVKLSSNENKNLFTSYLNQNPPYEVSVETVEMKSPHKDPKRESLKASKMAVPSIEEKSRNEIMHSKLKLTSCLFAMDEHYEEVEKDFLVAQQMPQEMLDESSLEEETLPLQRWSWSYNQTI